MQLVARTWFMYELTQSAVMLGFVGLGAAIPMLAVSLFGGVMADNMSKKAILVAGQAASGLVALGIAVSITLGTVSWVHLFVAAFFQGLVMALMMPARQAFIYELVGKKILINAIALNVAAMNTIRLLAPAFAGFFIALWSIEGVYYMMAALYAVGFLFAVQLPKTDSASQKKRPAIHELKEGLAYIRSNENVLVILFLTLLATILSMPYMFLLPIFTKDILTVDVAVFGKLTALPAIGPLLMSLGESSARQGLLISISGIGAVVGSLAIASIAFKRRGLVFLLSLLLTAMALVLFSTIGSFWLASIVFIPLGLGQASSLTLSNTLLQSITADAYRGRVMSVYMMNWGVTMVGVFLVGVLTDVIGPQLAVGGTAALLALITLYYLCFNQRVVRLG